MDDNSSSGLEFFFWHKYEWHFQILLSLQVHERDGPQSNENQFGWDYANRSKHYLWAANFHSTFKIDLDGVRNCTNSYKSYVGKAEKAKNKNEFPLELCLFIFSSRVEIYIENCTWYDYKRCAEDNSTCHKLNLMCFLHQVSHNNNIIFLNLKDYL